MSGTSRALVIGLTLLHLAVTTVSSIGVIGLELPWFTALALSAVLIFADRSMFFIFPAFLVGTLVFLSPMVLFDTRIASYSFRGDDVYDHELMLAFYWFIGCAPAYFLWGVRQLQGFDIRMVALPRTDASPIIAGMILVVFSMLMLRNGTILTISYKEVSAAATGLSVVEFASLFTLLGFALARTPAARNILIACVVVYLLSCLLSGLRLRFLSVSVVTVCCLWGMHPSQKLKTIGFGVALFLFVLGFVRTTGVAEARLSPRVWIELMMMRGSVDSTFGGAFQTAKFYAFYIDTLASMQGLRGVDFFIGDILSIFMTRGGTPGDIEIKTAAQVYFALPGGGLLPGYFWAYFGLPGAIVLSAAFMAIFTFILRAGNPALWPYKIILVAYIPRTLLYDWVIGFKMMFIFTVLVLFIRLLAAGTHSDLGGWSRNRGGRFGNL